MLRHFDRRARRLGRWRKNLHTRTGSAPRTSDAEAAEAIFATDLWWSDEDRILYFIGNLLPFGRVERRPRLYGNDFIAREGKRDAAGCARERKVEPVRIGILTIKLPGPANALIEKQPQFMGIKIRPTFEKKIFRHFRSFRCIKLKSLYPAL